jgi:hypothetical protein
MKQGRTRLEMDRYIEESRDETQDAALQTLIRTVRQQLTKSSSMLSNYSSKNKDIKKAESVVDKARKILFDLQD